MKSSASSKHGTKTVGVKSLARTCRHSRPTTSVHTSHNDQ